LAAKRASILQDQRAQEEAARQDKHRSEALNDECGEIEEDLEALKARFEMYFLGVDRREPVREREEMKRRVARLKGEFTRNTGLRFRIETLHARFLSYERMWMRSAREKEAGTYRRDLQRARRKAEVQEQKEAVREQPRAEANPAVNGAAGPAQAPASAPAGPAAAAPGATPPKAAPARPAAPPQLPSGMSEPQLRSLFEAYVSAKKRCNEDASRITYDGLAKTVAKQIPELMSRYKAKSVEFKVVIKDGRAVLKAVPRV
jgi:hypothetical protein